MKSVKIFSFLSLFLIPCFVSAKTEDFLVGDIRYTVDTEAGTASIEQQWFDDRGYIKEAIVKESVIYKGKEYPVISLGKNAFYGCGNLTEAVVPETVKTIGKNAFRACNKLVSVKLPSEVDFFGESVFDCCESLEKIELPKNLTVIPPFTFSECRGLKSIVIPDKVEVIESQSFQDCERLRDITLPPSIKEISSNFIPTRDANIYITDLLAFCNIDARGGLTKNNSWNLFLNGKEVTSLIIPEGIESMDVFYGCKSFLSISTPKSMKFCNIRDYNLETITFSSSTEEIRVWDSGWELKCVNVYALNPPKLSAMWNPTNAILHIPVGTKEVYMADENWSKFATIIDDLESESGLDDVVIDMNKAIVVYDMSGNVVSDTTDGLPSGIYIIRQNNRSKKIFVQ